MAVDDPYLIPGTQVLRNLIGIESAADLASAEADLVTARIVQLMDGAEDQLPKTRDWAELSAIHQHLFQDIYPWAGQMRVINMRKGDGELFAPYENLSTNLFHFSATLAEKKYLKIGNREEFIEEFLELYELLNWIHPFREGNGRVQRHFWSRVASDAGWLLDWRATYVQLGEATRLAREEGDLTQLRTVFNSVVAPGRAC